MVIIFSYGLLFLFGLSIYGWGRFVRRVLRLEPGSARTTLALGLAGFIWIGGWLNFAHIAYAALLDVTVAVGWILAGVHLWQDRQRLKAKWADTNAWFAGNSASFVVQFVLIAGLIAFNAATLIPTDTFNLRDDFQKYFSQPVRMLETGTLFGGPLSTIGFTELGGRAMLDAVLLSLLPFQYLNGVDPVFGLGLSLLLITTFAEGRRDRLAISVLGLLSVYLINPQSVNITALYLGSAFILSILAMTIDPRERNNGTAFPPAAAVGFLYGTLFCLKLSFALVIATHLVTLLLVFWFDLRRTRGLARWTLTCITSAVVSVVPWLLVHLPNYLAIGHRGWPRVDAGPNPPDSIDLFRWTPIHYMSRPLAYTVTVCAIWILSMGVGWLAWRSKTKNRSGAVAVCAAGFTLVIAYFVMLVFVSPRLSGYFQSYRYFTATFIGLAPAVLMGGLGIVSDALIAKPRIIRAAPTLILGFVPLLLFVPTLGERMREQYQYRTNLAYVAFATSDQNVQYCQNALSERNRLYVRQIQGLIPAGEPVIAWLDSSFHLDFRRNRIYEVDTAGIAAPWAKMPESRYLILQCEGLAVRKLAHYDHDSDVPGASDRSIARESFAFLKWLHQLIGRGRVIPDDGTMLVVELPPDASRS